MLFSSFISFLFIVTNAKKKRTMCETTFFSSSRETERKRVQCGFVYKYEGKREIYEDNGLQMIVARG